MLLLHFLQTPLPDPGYLAGFEKLGIVGILVGVIFGLIAAVFWLVRALQTGRLVTEIRHKEIIAIKDTELSECRSVIKERDRTIAIKDDELNQRARDAVRLADEFKTMTLNVVGAVVGRNRDA